MAVGQLERSEAGYFKQSWLTPIKYAKGNSVTRVRALDLAASVPSET